MAAEYTEYLEFACRVAAAAGAEILPHFREPRLQLGRPGEVSARKVALELPFPDTQ